MANSTKPESQNFAELPSEEQAFVVAYIENSYSVKHACDAIRKPEAFGKKLLKNIKVRKAIYDLQQELDDIDFLNEKWAKAKLMELYPKVVGEEKVQIVDNMGDNQERYKFYPDIAMRIIEYVAPKAKEQKAPGDEEDETVHVYLPDNGRKIVE